MVNYRANPLNLSEDDIRWVENTYLSMSVEERIGQLFCPIGYSSDPGYLRHAILSKHPGGILFRTGANDEIASTYRFLQENSRIPMFTAANAEAGGDGIVDEGTSFGKQMQVAASGKAENAYRLGKVCAREARAVGCNYAFAPVVDIDFNWRNPITNVRTYGSDPEAVLRYAKEYQRAMAEEGLLTAIKHFPGDGVDERDQHILTSVNSLSQEEWLSTYGKVYGALIEDGAKSVMIGHIALPAFEEDEGIIPASLSPAILRKLLRGRLHFNGLIISDATPMVGFCSAMDRKTAVPYSIMAGIDMFLFNKDYDEDYGFMMEGYRTGLLTEERLREAVTTILATKASIGLHRKANGPEKEYESYLRCEEHLAWARECASDAITLVKDTQRLLPISPERHHRVLYEILGESASNERITGTFLNLMAAEGFEMIPYEKEVFDFSKPLPFDTISQFREKYDLVIYLGNIENASNKTTNRINWYTLFGLGNNIPWFVKEVPTLFVSLQNPYHLADVPMISTYVNCYSNHDLVLEELVKKLEGKDNFRGVSPVDPYCSMEYLKK